MLGLLLTAAAAPHLTPDGWGKVRIGMSQPQVAKTLGATLEGEAIEDEAACVEKIAAAFPGSWAATRRPAPSGRKSAEW